uniref:Nucleolar 27S pre-rRNA processing Urb2/Npa2 C-terminal domain-containing protein n=1 Tax=Peronospora matthiolae TaxID=2874970 RepID=A0AAV1UVZ2_9STRA
MTKSSAWGGALAFVRWQHTRRSYDGDASLLHTGVSLLQPDADLRFGPQSALVRAERAFNLPRQRIVSEALQFAVFLITKSKHEDGSRLEQTRLVLQLLQLALNAFVVNGDAELATLSLNSCNLMLSALAETLEKEQQEYETLQTVKAVLFYLFRLPDDLSEAASATFQMYRPPTNVFAEFLRRTLTASFKSMMMYPQKISSDEKKSADQEKVYVDLMHAALFVFQELQKTQTNKKKVFLAIAKMSLRDFVEFRYSLVLLEKRGVAGVDAVRALLDHVVTDALFDAEYICQFDGAMVHAAIWHTGCERKDAAQEELNDKKTKKRRKAAEGAKSVSGLVSYQKTLFDELLRLLTDRQVQSELKMSLGGFFKMLVRAFATRIRTAANSKIEDAKTDLKTSRKRAAIVIASTSTTHSPFKFWSELCAVVYTAFQQEVQSDDSLLVLVTLYDALFRALCESDVYRVTEDTREHEQFRTMELVLSSFLGVLDAKNGDQTYPNGECALGECKVISSAVQCSPNLANCCLVPIFTLLGVKASGSGATIDNGDGKGAVTVAASHAIIELIHAYDSMRKLDAFLHAAFAIQQGHKGLYELFALPSCKLAFRKAFVALPPGQLAIIWKLLVKQIASFARSSDDIHSVRGVAIARLVFQIFVQEVQVVPQNRPTVLELVSHSYQHLLSCLANGLAHAMGLFTAYQRELFCIFGELLMYDSVLDASTRKQTFDQIFDKLEGDRFGKAMEQLLCTFSSRTVEMNKKGSEWKSDDSEAMSLSIGHGLGAAGIVKLCAYWLRNIGASSGVAEDKGKVSREGREKVAHLVIEHVVNWKCWEAVSFHLPELMASASRDGCGSFFREILSAYISEAVSGEEKASAKLIIRDAGFYEIPSIRDVAPDSLTAVAKGFVDQVQHKSVATLSSARHFFSFLLEVPSAYLKPRECGELLVTALTLYRAIVASANYTSCKVEVCRTVLAWIQLHFKVISIEAHKSQKTCPKYNEQLQSGASFIISRIAVDDIVSVALVAKMLGTYLDMGASAFVGGLLHSILGTETVEAKCADKVTGKVKRAVMVVQALAACRTSLQVSKNEKEFIERVVDIIAREKVCESTRSPLAFEALAALLRYESVLHKVARHDKRNGKAMTVGSPALQLLVKHVGRALASSMKLISEFADDIKLQDAALVFFAGFCEEYASFRTFATPLKTYGCMLAVSLSLVSRETAILPRHENTKVLALQAVVANANRDEFRLLLSTLVQELAARERQRKLGALRALCLLLGGERKFSASRRLSLIEYKESIVEALLQDFAVQSLPAEAGPSAVFQSASALRVWNLKTFVLVFSKAGLYTWKAHELQHVFTGFQPLLTAVSSWQAGANTYQPDELHELWTLSYTLLLRIVRTHFATLVNSIQQLVQAANALLQMLVLTSAHSEYSVCCSEWSSNLARLYGYMKEHDVQLRKYVIYLLMAILVGVSRDKLAVRFQHKLRPGVFALLDVCSSYEKDQLFGALDSAGKSLLKTLDTNYKLTHRYVGKV